MARRGQASLEYILVSALSLSLLIVSASALVGIKAMAERGVASASFRSGATALANAANEACALGSGNGIEIILGSAISAESEKAEDGGYMVRYHGPGDGAIVLPCRCKVAGVSGQGGGPVYVKNKEGEITIRER